MCRGSGPWLAGLCAASLGAGILVASIFPTGLVLFVVALALMACGWLCCKGG